MLEMIYAKKSISSKSKLETKINRDRKENQGKLFEK